MAKIHALLVAVAEKNSIRIPLEALPAHDSLQAGGNTTDPAIGRYDSLETVRYQLDQRPTEMTCSFLGWGEIFAPLRPARLDVRRTDEDDDPPKNPGLSNVLSWTIPWTKDLHGAYCYYDEFGYDEDGYVCRLGQEDPTPPSGLGETQPPTGSNVINEYMVS